VEYWGVRGLKFKSKIMQQSMKQEDIDKLFSGELTEKQIDEKYGIQRKPWIGCLVTILGTLLIWSIIGYFIYGIFSS
jgi:hypothetical protein